MIFLAMVQTSLFTIIRENKVGKELSRLPPLAGLRRKMLDFPLLSLSAACLRQCLWGWKCARITPAWLHKLRWENVIYLSSRVVPFS